MGFGSLWHWVVVLIVVVLVFGAGKLPQVGGDVAKAIKSFKKGLKDDTETAQAEKLENKPADGNQGKV